MDKNEKKKLREKRKQVFNQLQGAADSITQHNAKEINSLPRWSNDLKTEESTQKKVHDFFYFINRTFQSLFAPF